MTNCEIIVKNVITNPDLPEKCNIRILYWIRQCRLTYNECTASRLATAEKPTRGILIYTTLRGPLKFSRCQESRLWCTQLRGSVNPCSFNHFTLPDKTQYKLTIPTTPKRPTVQRSCWYTMRLGYYQLGRQSNCLFFYRIYQNV